MPTDYITDALEKLSIADRALAGITPRHGCVYKAPNLQCPTCISINEVRRTIAAHWIRLGGGDKHKLWWEKEEDELARERQRRQVFPE